MTQSAALVRMDSLYACQRAVATLHNRRFAPKYRCTPHHTSSRGGSQEPLVVKFALPSLSRARSDDPVRHCMH